MDTTQAKNDGAPEIPRLQRNEFIASQLHPGQILLVHVGDERVAVYNADGAYYATQDRCSHTGWPLSDGGELIGNQVTCPLHGWCYDVTTGAVIRGGKSLNLKTYRIVVEGEIGRVLPSDSIA
ncbi:MAG: Rieske 2Fe-2S domain-containing protein [Chloroflexi bacterium]|nr:Rieske 2Fe-2S domain-containing protein [Chloroflexota bacterium]MCL5273764.1 Rieske 2Fe-2S domain-containing protein [Chloroflexota bacterium]